MVERQHLRERAAGRDADDMRGGDAVRVEHAGGVGDEVARPCTRDGRARR